MAEKLKLRTILILLSAFVLFACASGKEQYQIGMQLNAAGKYKEAINYLEVAIQKEPNNKKYQSALAEIRESLVNKYTQEAAQELSSSSPITVGAVNNAKAKLGKAIEIDAGHTKVKKLQQKISNEEKRLFSEVSTLYAKTREFIDQGKWIEAYFNIQQIQSMFPNYEDTYQLMRKITSEGAEDLYNKGRREFEREEFKKAAEMVQKALSLQPDHRASIELLQQARANDNKDYFIEKAKNAVSNRDWTGALKYFRKVLEYDPGNKDLLKTVALAKANSGRSSIEKAKSFMEKGWLLKAVRSMQDAEGYIDNNKDYALISLKKELARRALAAAIDSKDKGLYGAAWFWYGKLKEIEPKDKNVFEYTLQMEDKISDRVRKSIAVFDFASPSNSPDAGGIFANNLSNYLFNNASGDIQIMERSRIKPIVEELKIGQIGMVNEQTRKKMGDLYGIDVAIMGDVLVYKVDTTMSQSTKSVRYQVGTKIEDNIEYLNWKAKHPKPSDKELESAPPAKITIPEFTTSKYNVSNHKKVGFIQLSFRIVDVSTGENIQVKTIERKVVEEDETSAGLEEAGIKFDPLEIATDTELLNRMTNEVVAELGREVLKPLQNLENIYYQDGVTSMKRRDPVAATESFVNAILDEKLKMIQDSPLSQQAIRKLEEIFLNTNISIF